MYIIATIVAYAFYVFYFKNATIVAFMGLRINDIESFIDCFYIWWVGKQLHLVDDEMIRFFIIIIVYNELKDWWIAEILLYF